MALGETVCSNDHQNTQSLASERETTAISTVRRGAGLPRLELQVT